VGVGTRHRPGCRVGTERDSWRSGPAARSIIGPVEVKPPTGSVGFTYGHRACFETTFQARDGISGDVASPG
jgi:hypothetical protein